MPCYRPLQAVSGADPLTGEVRVAFGAAHTVLDGKALEVPCGQCIGCRISRARQWAVRCLHESQLHQDNAFVTLTYSDENLPRGLVLRDLQLFLKRLRHYSDRKFRYFAVGEYGEKLSRPHYHVLLFGLDFADKKRHRRCGRHWLYTSALLEKAWRLGWCPTGSVTTESAQYVAAYSIKQVRGHRAAKHYQGRPREFSVMSRNPGIGAGWIDRYAGDVFPSDFVVVPGGRKVAVPRYYTNRQPVAVQELAKALREKRNAPEDVYAALERRPAIEKFVELREKHFNERRLSDEVSSLRGA